MSSLPSFDTENEPKIARSVEKFFKDYKVMELLRRCGLRKSKGIPLWSILSYIFSNVFRDRSMYMQQKSGKCTAGFSKNTYYRFMQNPHINWLRLTILLAERIVNGRLKDLTSDQRADCFVFDDSLYSRTGYKKTELAAFYRPYDLITGHIKVIHGNEIVDLPLSYQLPALFNGGSGNITLQEISDGQVANGSDLNLTLPLELGFNQNTSDLFGTSPVTVPDFSFNIQGPVGQNITDWLTLGGDKGQVVTKNRVGNVTYSNDAGNFQVSLTPHGNMLTVNVHAMQLAVNADNATKEWTATISLHVQVPKTAFTDSDAAVQFNTPSFEIPMNIGQAQFASQELGLTFNVVRATDDVQEQIQYQRNKTYQNINAGHYITDNGGFMPDKQSSLGQQFGGEYYRPGYKVAGLSNVGDKDLQDIHYTLNIPDGLSVYSVTYHDSELKNAPDSMVLSLSDGSSISLTKADLQGSSAISLWHDDMRQGKR